MKKILSLLLALCLLTGLTACAKQSEPPAESEPTQSSGRILVAYFSATGHTKEAAEKLAELTGGKLYEIVAAEPYTADDLNYSNEDCRANREMNDATARPAIGGDGIDLSGYDTVLLGYPIWWGTAPRIIQTFLDTHDLSGKMILPFCTSGSSGIDTSVSLIRDAVPAADVRDGLRVTGGQDAMESWLQENGIH